MYWLDSCLLVCRDTVPKFARKELVDIPFKDPSMNSKLVPFVDPLPRVSILPQSLVTIPHLSISFILEV